MLEDNISRGASHRIDAIVTPIANRAVANNHVGEWAERVYAIH